MPKHDDSPQSSPTNTTASSQSGDRGSSAKERLDEILDRNHSQEEEELALRRKLVPRLAKRAYHLEDGNTWCQDWVQYQRNTHPVFGLCMYHRLHPIRFTQRVIVLVGSIAFGFAITNCVYLGFLSSENAGDTVNSIYAAFGTAAEVQQRYTNVELEQSLVFLITAGSFLHSTFDMFIWYLMACYCCRPGGPCQRVGECCRLDRACQGFGIYVAVLAVVAAIVVATFVAVERLSQDLERPTTLAEELAADQLGGGGGDNPDSEPAPNTNLTFLVGYALELGLALFVFYFFTSTVFFSGILGCGRIPVLGGRPYELRRARLNKRDGDDDDDDEGVEVEYVDEDVRGITIEDERGRTMKGWEV